MLSKIIKEKSLVDHSVSYTLLTRVLQGFGGLLLLFLITKFLSNEEQGYYYVFISILSLQVLFELGTTSIITQYIAHEFVHLSWSAQHELIGDKRHLSRAVSIIQLSLKWLAILTVIMFFGLWVGGFIFFSLTGDQQVNWKTGWFIFSFSGSAILLINLVYAIFEGLGYVTKVNQFRFFQQLVYLSAMILLLIFKAGLAAAGISLLLSLLISIVLLYKSNFLYILLKIWKRHVSEKIDYRREVFPFQMRIALGTVAGYLIYQLINPLVFVLEGPLAAGQIGASQAVLNGLLALSLSWMSTKVSLFSNLVAVKNFDALDQHYRNNLLICSCCFIFGCALFLIGTLLLQNYYPSYGNRFLSLLPLLFLCLTQLASVIGNCQAYYLRSFKEEPFFVVSIVISILSGISTIFFLKYYDIESMTFAFFVVNGLIGFIWGTVIFYKKRKEWTLN